ncbi:MAG: nicotinate-nucleotide--dimethylbenzimidazole phosphoribosyltransferase [Candidatus Lambdaproteobacteria bacterium RIFOXYD1_FULL_56_27]|uniref:Nicotinate-nucleotide--dimethylbenzimidazole phosphoribosyltransferase n=1 Tax=Candidatus Lambdaproteobacteria bacterium RIFOXYD2_FULL_56_26 TaxID=1817773 RepID=A0A1F6H3N5_9PROT|nr:MAG: nicotinate-nucleotide--dimethylbenzimidazole phosphoribosyltransferase [Candidatus Lambdaproteobacteria bacterium RIFOXYC1_FULL_56_13]OGH04991.1 MAG: nicotinate-nucleotide--dimethylbenzimidazole phosphoribosyltransferase [Candidatus Lambdaproteobacteria bacterium RIFOXYD2_FULL_56_26]OGH09456.1 MAG: nicotinate-nucleotide--dimethylbenzimidazole phosphoribosyltransferase [Candidatus Lambdaproteobacteria bacterium RIFOXYD1_FULL_56_27]
MNQKLKDWLARIEPLGSELTPALLAHQNDLTKPQGALGRLEEVAVWLGRVQNSLLLQSQKKRIYCFAGDHGVVEEGVSAYPKEVTPQMVGNMLAGGAAINQLAQAAQAELWVVDLGVDAELAPHPKLVQKKVAKGTANLAQGPAMTLEQVQAAIWVGIELAQTSHQEGVHLLGTGEMGIGNSTSAAALICAYLKLRPEAVVGRGTGVNDQGLKHKTQVVARALDLHQQALDNPLETLAALGGLEIAGITGLVLGAAALKIAVVVDGFISSAGALAAIALKPEVKDYLIFSHLSAETGHQAFAQALGVRPLVNLDLRLGEGTGAALAFGLIEGAVACHNQMATFSGASVSRKVEALLKH